MHIVSMKQEEIRQLKHKIFQLEKLQLALKLSQKLTKQLIASLQEQNLQLKHRIIQIEGRQNAVRQIIYLKGQFDMLKQKNLELQQKRSNLISQIYNTRLSFDHMNLWTANDIKRTYCNDNYSHHSQNGCKETSFVAPRLVDSCYISLSCIQKENEQDSAHPEPEYTELAQVLDWKSTIKQI